MKLVFKEGPRHRFRDQLFWAVGGLIAIENQLDGSFKVMTRLEAAARVIALNAELKYIEYPSERDELTACVVALAAAVKEAKRQGDPTDPEVRKQRLKDRWRATMITGIPVAMPGYGGVGQAAIIEPHSDRFRNLRI